MCHPYKKVGIHVECTCCLMKSGITCFPFPSTRHGGCSSSVTYDTNSPPSQSFFPTSLWFEYVSWYFQQWRSLVAFNGKKQRTSLNLDWRAFHGDLNLSLSVPKVPELLPLIPFPYDSNMDHEDSNTIMACLEVSRGKRLEGSRWEWLSSTLFGCF